MSKSQATSCHNTTCGAYAPSGIIGELHLSDPAVKDPVEGIYGKNWKTQNKYPGRFSLGETYSYWRTREKLTWRFNLSVSMLLWPYLQGNLSPASQW